MKTIKHGRCGICDINFKSYRERDAHFKSKSHLNNINDPELMAQKTSESQTEITMTRLLNELRN